MAFSPGASGRPYKSGVTSAPWTISASRCTAGSSIRYLRTMASKLHRPAWWPNSTPGTSNGVAPSRLATSATSSAGTNKNSAAGSTNLRISHGHATRSTFTRSRVTHFMARSPRYESARPTPASVVSPGGLLLRVEGGLQAFRQFFRLALAPEVGEVERRLLADHVIVQGDDVDARLP